MDGYRVELACCTKTLLAEIVEWKFKRNTVALTYAMAILSTEPTDWKAVNEAIVKRWSAAALKYIKERAWKFVEEKRREQATRGTAAGVNGQTCPAADAEVSF